MATPKHPGPRGRNPRPRKPRPDLTDYHEEYWPKLEELNRMCPGASKICQKVPVLALALAEQAGTRQAKRTLLRLKHGGGIDAACARMGIPPWMKKLPASAFQPPLQALLIPQAVAEPIAQFAPSDAVACKRWLRVISQAWQLAEPTELEWLARLGIYDHPSADGLSARPLLLYFWGSRCPGYISTRRLRRCWSRTESLWDAVVASQNWMNRLKLWFFLGSGQTLPAWLENGTANGFEFKALVTERALRAHSVHQSNCVDQFADRLTDHTCRLFAISKDGQAVGTVEIVRHPQNTAAPQIGQIKGKVNRPASLDMFRATYAWIGSQSGASIPCRLESPNCRVISPDNWQEIWGPLLATAAARRLLGETDPVACLEAIDQELKLLGRLSGRDSYLFGLRTS